MKCLDISEGLGTLKQMTNFVKKTQGNSGLENHLNQYGGIHTRWEEKAWEYVLGSIPA